VIFRRKSLHLIPGLMLALIAPQPMSKEQARCPTVPLCGKSDMTPRGNGRSESGPREAWDLAQDARAFWDALSIVNPIDLGASFEGWRMGCA
jgi:hypothetical protein